MTATPSAPGSRGRRRALVIGGIAAAFAVLVVIGQLTMNRGGTPDAGARTPPAAASSTPGSAATPGETAAPVPQSSSRSGDSPLARRDPADPMAVGSIDAPVVLIEWTDLRCPFCASFSRETLPAIMADYVDTGLVRIEVRDVAYFGEQSEDASVAAQAAAAQGRYIEFLDAVFDAAPESGHPDLPRDTLIAFAEVAGVPDIARFTADLDDPALHAAVQEETGFAQQIGVSAVPFFVAGDVSLSGAQPIDIFRGYLDQALAKAG